MNVYRNRAPRRAVVSALILSAVGMCFATSSHADSRAAQKLGQIGVINQTLQPKPVKSSPGAYSNSATNANTANNANANAANAANAANSANARAAAVGTGAPQPGKSR